MLGLSRSCTALKARKIGRHLRRLNLNLRGKLPSTARLVFDELETFESRRSIRPLSVPWLVEAQSRFVIWAESAPIRAKGKMTKRRIRAIEADAARFGPRPDTSRRACERTLRRGAEMLAEASWVEIDTDEKSTYPKLIRQAFKGHPLIHGKTNSKRPRDTWNRLFPVNHEEAMGRDLMGRLRRESWLVSKRRRWLDVALHVHIAYRNLVRPKTNWIGRTPAQLLGFVSRALESRELFRWRQDWGRDSLDPADRRGLRTQRA